MSAVKGSDEVGISNGRAGQADSAPKLPVFVNLQIAAETTGLPRDGGRNEPGVGRSEISADNLREKVGCLCFLDEERPLRIFDKRCAAHAGNDIVDAAACGNQRVERRGMEQIVGVEKQQVRPAGAGDSLISCDRFSLVLLPNYVNGRAERLGDRGRIVRRAVVDDDHLERRPGLGEDRLDRRAQKAAAIVTRGDDRNCGIGLRHEVNLVDSLTRERQASSVVTLTLSEGARRRQMRAKTSVFPEDAKFSPRRPSLPPH